jgi:hypothetical protein
MALKQHDLSKIFSINWTNVLYFIGDKTNSLLGLVRNFEKQAIKDTETF